MTALNWNKRKAESPLQRDDCIGKDDLKVSQYMHRYECDSFNLVLYQSEVSAPTTPSGGIPPLSMLQASDHNGYFIGGYANDDDDDDVVHVGTFG